MSNVNNYEQVPLPVGVVNDPGYGPDPAAEDHIHQIFAKEHILPLLFTWENYNNNYPLKVQKAANICIIEGYVKSTIEVTDERICQLPVEYRPTKDQEFQVMELLINSSGDIAGVLPGSVGIYTTGEVWYLTPAVGAIIARINFNCIAYKLE